MKERGRKCGKVGELHMQKLGATHGHGHTFIGGYTWAWGHMLSWAWGGRSGPCYWFICTGATGRDGTCSSYRILCIVKPQMIPFSIYHISPYVVMKSPTLSVHHCWPRIRAPTEVLLCWPKTFISIAEKK